MNVTLKLTCGLVMLCSKVKKPVSLLCQFCAHTTMQILGIILFVAVATAAAQTTIGCTYISNGFLNDTQRSPPVVPWKDPIFVTTKYM